MDATNCWRTWLRSVRLCRPNRFSGRKAAVPARRMVNALNRPKVRHRRHELKRDYLSDNQLPTYDDRLERRLSHVFVTGRHRSSRVVTDAKRSLPFKNVMLSTSISPLLPDVRSSRAARVSWVESDSSPGPRGALESDGYLAKTALCPDTHACSFAC
jgi:hypothetical protein